MTAPTILPDRLSQLNALRLLARVDAQLIGLAAIYADLGLQRWDTVTAREQVDVIVRAVQAELLPLGRVLSAERVRDDFHALFEVWRRRDEYESGVLSWEDVADGWVHVDRRDEYCRNLLDHDVEQALIALRGPKPITLAA